MVNDNGQKYLCCHSWLETVCYWYPPSSCRGKEFALLVPAAVAIANMCRYARNIVTAISIYSIHFIVKLVSYKSLVLSRCYRVIPLILFYSMCGSIL